MAIIHLDNIRVQAIIGTLERERKTRQELVLSIQVEYDSRKAVKTDNVTYALDYSQLTEDIINRVETGCFFLLERLVDDVLKFILKQQMVQNAAVTITKPQALGKEQVVAVKAFGTNKPKK